LDFLGVVVQIETATRYERGYVRKKKKGARGSLLGVRRIERNDIKKAGPAQKKGSKKIVEGRGIGRLGGPFENSDKTGTSGGLGMGK